MDFTTFKLHDQLTMPKVLIRSSAVVALVKYSEYATIIRVVGGGVYEVDGHIDEVAQALGITDDVTKRECSTLSCGATENDICDVCRKVLPREQAIYTCNQKGTITLCRECYVAAGNSVR